jgi:hypothetical protein
MFLRMLRRATRFNWAAAFGRQVAVEDPSDDQGRRHRPEDAAIATNVRIIATDDKAPVAEPLDEPFDQDRPRAIWIVQGDHVARARAGPAADQHPIAGFKRRLHTRIGYHEARDRQSDHAPGVD